MPFLLGSIMTDWPATLPCLQMSGASYTPQDNLIRSEVAAGVAKVRRRFSAVAETFSARVLVNKAQVETLDTFVKVTLKDALPFDMKNYRLPGYPTRSYRFVRRPSYVPVAFDLWEASLELEMLP